MAHMDTQRNSNLCLHLQALETRWVDDSIEAFGNYISFLFQAFVALRYRQGMKENRKVSHSWTKRKICESLKLNNIKKTIA